MKNRINKLIQKAKEISLQLNVDVDGFGNVEWHLMDGKREIGQGGTIETDVHLTEIENLMKQTYFQRLNACRAVLKAS